jgi:hypothetical protein
LNRLQNQYRAYDQNVGQWQNAARQAILYGGGGGGGVRTIDNRPQVRERYNTMRDRAEGRYGSARADVGQLYDQLATAYQGLPEQAARRFEVATEGATDQTERLMQETAARVNEEAAARAAQAAELGIDPTAMEDLNETVDYQTGEMGRTGANWSGLMGALSTSEQTRGQLAYEGALDTGVMAKEDLLSRYNDYLEMLDANESQELMGAIQQVAAGSGRSAANLPAGILEALFLEEFYNTGISDGTINSADDTSSFTSIAVNKTQVKLFTSDTERARLTEANGECQIAYQLGADLQGCVSAYLCVNYGDCGGQNMQPIEPLPGGGVYRDDIGGANNG